MSLAIDRIYISNEEEKQEGAFLNHEGTDVIVSMKSGEKFHASFFSFDSLEGLRRRYFKSGEFLHGAYFWSKRMVLVKDCSRETIERVVTDLLEGGELWEAFMRL
ncbi:MAG: hypothetical protein H6557_13040 [Lewinellaceae bacterium]|nr:hypothetical protein [Phaeodactylibacter sp.]MCB9037534.1 hypothetical protein [Lewinellaceae bacterium]